MRPRRRSTPTPRAFPPSAGHGTKHDFIGGTASLMTFPERGLVVAVTSNTSFADTSALALGIAQAFAEQLKAPPVSSTPIGSSPPK
jgi:hypothetical protein